MSYRPIGHGTRPQYARGFTLVELLIAMALTLMLVYAVAQFYAYVGETVRDGRAQIEMGGQLRAAADRLRQDLAELTVRVGGRIDAGAGQGVLELIEGIASDSDPDGDRSLNANGISLDLGDPNGDGKPDGPMLGDCDDILVMTIRSQGEPFVGRLCQQVLGSNPPQYFYSMIQSNLAEVTWFTTFKDVSGDGLWQMAEPRFLVRRQLLIISPNQLPAAGLVAPAGQNFFHHNDISCHVSFGGGGPYFALNSLADLSQRENRFVHLNLSDLTQNGLFSAQGYMPNRLQLNVGLTGAQQGSCSVYSLDGVAQFQGEDKMLSNVLAFDMRVYDPYAVLRADDADIAVAQGVLSPGDPGYAYATANNFPSYLSVPPNGIGVGAYVDLWYNRGFGNNTGVYQNTAYSWAPNSTLPPPPPFPQIPPLPDPQMPFPPVTINFRPFVANGPAIWETWSTAYEKDGLRQLPDGNNGIIFYNWASFDWMVDGLDNRITAIPPSGGVDDPTESDTRVPYPSWVGDNGVDDNGDGIVDDNAERNYPQRTPTTLRGIEVRIRMYEPGTRQTRQVTVGTDFVPE